MPSGRISIPKALMPGQIGLSSTGDNMSNPLTLITRLLGFMSAQAWRDDTLVRVEQLKEEARINNLRREIAVTQEAIGARRDKNVSP